MSSNIDFKDFCQLYKLENRPTTGEKILYVAKQIGLESFDIYLRNNELTTKQGVINLSNNPFKGTHWVAYNGNKYSDSYLVEPPKEIKQHMKKLANTDYIESYIDAVGLQNEKSLCAAYCLYFLYLSSLGIPYRKVMVILITQFKFS